MVKKKNGETWGVNTVKEPGPAALDPYCGLAAALLKRTAKEAQAGDCGAAEWLLGDLAGWLCDILELDSLAMQRVALGWLENSAGRIVIKLL